MKKSAIAALLNTSDKDNQALLELAARQLLGRGHKIVGVIAESPRRGTDACSAGFLRDIASGERFSIHLEQAPARTKCHLDAGGVKKACAWLVPQIPFSEVVVLSKIGKLEADRQGLWRAFQAAISQGKPLLTTVSPKHLNAWMTLAPEASRLYGETAEIVAWFCKLEEKIQGSAQFRNNTV
jgi:nucleoside-triphosphatase THEP1